MTSHLLHQLRAAAIKSIFICVLLDMAVVHDITENEFSEIDAFLNAEASQAKELGLEPDTAIEAIMIRKSHRNTGDHYEQVRLKDLNFNFLEGMASQLLYDNVDEMLKGCGFQANDVIAVILSSTSPKQSTYRFHFSWFF